MTRAVPTALLPMMLSGLTWHPQPSFHQPLLHLLSSLGLDEAWPVILLPKGLFSSQKRKRPGLIRYPLHAQAQMAVKTYPRDTQAGRLS